MGMFRVAVRVSNPAEESRVATLDLLVDTGAAFTVISGARLAAIGVQSTEERVFTVADGRQIRRKIGRADLGVDGRRERVKVVFGEEGDAQLLGALALQQLELDVDALNERLTPATLYLLGDSPGPVAPAPAKPAPVKKPKPVAWIDPHGCSGEPCQVCIAFCPVDCIRLVTNDPEFAGPTGYCVVEQEKCIGCNLCAMYCPWDDIVMVQPPVAAAPAPAATPVRG